MHHSTPAVPNHSAVVVSDEVRRRTVGDEVTYVVNRNINYTNICTFKCAPTGTCPRPCLVGRHVATPCLSQILVLRQTKDKGFDKKFLCVFPFRSDACFLKARKRCKEWHSVVVDCVVQNLPTF